MARYRPRPGVHWWDTLTNIRCEAGLSRAELAASLDVHYSTIYSIEKGHQTPSQAVLDWYGVLAEGRRRSETA